MTLAESQGTEDRTLVGLMGDRGGPGGAQALVDSQGTEVGWQSPQGTEVGWQASPGTGVASAPHLPGAGKCWEQNGDKAGRRRGQGAPWGHSWAWCSGSARREGEGPPGQGLPRQAAGGPSRPGEQQARGTSGPLLLLQRRTSQRSARPAGDRRTRAAALRGWAWALQQPLGEEPHLGQATWGCFPGLDGKAPWPPRAGRG